MSKSATYANTDPMDRTLVGIAAAGSALLAGLAVNFLGSHLCRWQTGPGDWNCCVTVFMLLASMVALTYGAGNRWRAGLPAVAGIGLFYDFFMVTSRYGRVTTPLVAFAMGLGMSMILFVWATERRPKPAIWLAGGFLISQVIVAMVWKDSVDRANYYSRLWATTQTDGRLTEHRIEETTGLHLIDPHWFRTVPDPMDAPNEVRYLAGRAGVAKEIAISAQLSSDGIFYDLTLPIDFSPDGNWKDKLQRYGIGKGFIESLIKSDYNDIEEIGVGYVAVIEQWNGKWRLRIRPRDYRDR